MATTPFRPRHQHCHGRPRLAAVRSNSTLLHSLQHSRADAIRLHWRNALVSQNLGLVRQVANRESRRTGRDFDDLYSAGVEGLIRAVEAYDSRQGGALSSIAIPWIRGAMRMDHRDRQQPVRTPRRLRELLQRATRLQEQRRGAGLPPLAGAALAAALDCSQEQLAAAASVRQALAMESLDRPLGGSDGEAGPSLLDQLATTGTDASGSDDRQWQWLQAALEALEPGDRELLEGRWIDGLSWQELAARQGLSASHCRARGRVLLAHLQSTAGMPPASQGQTSRASRPAMAV